MKKTISLLLAIVLCLSLCACEQNSTPSDNQTAEAPTEAIKEENPKLTQEEMVAESTELTDEMWKKITENKAYANSLVGTSFSFMACVEEIATDYIVMNVVNSEFVSQACLHSCSERKCPCDPAWASVRKDIVLSDAHVQTTAYRNTQPSRGS